MLARDPALGDSGALWTSDASVSVVSRYCRDQGSESATLDLRRTVHASKGEAIAFLCWKDEKV